MDNGKKIAKLISGFMMNEVATGQIDIYNEFSLQHELGIYLRTNFPPPWKIEFERNVSFFDIAGTRKKEIDIVVYRKENDAIKEKYAIELKNPNNGQYPEQMRKFIEDIIFMEQLKDKGFNGTFCLTFTYDDLFFDGHNGRKTSGVYGYFRNGKEIKKDDVISDLRGEYLAIWNECGRGKYYVISILN